MNLIPSANNLLVVLTPEQVIQLIQEALKPLVSKLDNPGFEQKMPRIELKNSGNDLLSTKEAADILGVSLSTLKIWKKNRLIPYSQASYKGRIFFRKSDLEAFLEKNKKRKYH
jgi:excisionase family DNA binding protein